MDNAGHISEFLADHQWYWLNLSVKPVDKPHPTER